jgi:cell division protein YceG involved in septum cleavage
MSGVVSRLFDFYLIEYLMKTFLTSLVVLFGIISAICWIVSATVKVKANGAPRHDGWEGGSVQDGEGNDVVQTLKRQSKWNSAATVFASIAAISQAISSYI